MVEGQENEGKKWTSNEFFENQCNEHWKSHLQEYIEDQMEKFANKMLLTSSMFCERFKCSSKKLTIIDQALKEAEADSNKHSHQKINGAQMTKKYVVKINFCDGTNNDFYPDTDDALNVFISQFKSLGTLEVKNGDSSMFINFANVTNMVIRQWVK